MTNEMFTIVLEYASVLVNEEWLGEIQNSHLTRLVSLEKQHTITTKHDGRSAARNATATTVKIDSRCHSSYRAFDRNSRWCG